MAAFSVSHKVFCVFAFKTSSGKMLFLRKLVIVTIVVAVALTEAQHKGRPYETRSKFVTKEVARDVSDALVNLARNISVQIRSKESKSEIISPLSIGSSMLLLLRASRGSTRQELLKLLGLNKKYQRNDPKVPRNFGQLIEELLDDVRSENVLKSEPQWKGESKCISPEYADDDDDYEEYEDFDGVSEQDVNIIRLANAIFVQNGTYDNEKLEVRVRRIYRSEIESVDFVNSPDESKAVINQWIDKNTNGRIKEVITDQLSRDTTMVVANAMYFKAFWEDVFTAGATKPRKFFPDGESEESVEVDMMSHGGCFPYYASKELDARILGFPYKNKTITMYIILPNKSNRKNLQDLVGKLDANTLDELISNTTMRTASVLFPKMHITNSFELKSALRLLGLSSMFIQGRSNFSLLNTNMTIANSPTVGGVLHKVDLEVNEEGTEGGAVTATLMDRSLPSINFRVITPFVLAIRHDATKLLLFYGSVYDPSSE
ncbi:serine protease inhibitor 28Dc-like isoform X1 [Culex pipiens pallens]|uniref:serine protease inhibitor 28Dc-like isoform X1 n=2 Tax=Culex pipiens pallens TaxID=42434 RepID=UPI0019545F88|nr:serine protease inhibitor 28Dc-like isoform X1 [Culex pipiens pallens]